MQGLIHQSNKLKLNVLLLSLSLVLVACETEEEAAEGHLTKGIELLEKGDYAAAKLELKSATKGDKSTAETYYYLALLDEKAKHYLAMQDNLQKTLEIEPGNHKARIKLGKLELLMGAFEKADEHANVLLEKNAEDIDALVLKSSVLLRQNKQDEATPVINHIIALEPLNVDGLTLQAMLLMQKEQLAEALALINKAILQDEKNVSLHIFKIQIHSKQKDVNAVISDYQTLIRLFPENDNFRITLAKILAQSNKVVQAEDLLRDFVAEKPKQLKPKILLLEFLQAQASDKLNQQMDEFTRQLTDKPKQLIDFSKWMIAKGYTLKAKEILQQVVDKKGDTDIGIEANLLLAKIAFDSMDYDETKRIANDILQAEPNQLDAKLLQVRLLLVEEQFEKAKTYLDKVIWSHPKSDEALVLLAQYYLVKGDRQQAEAKFKAALDLNPANIQAFIPVYNSLIAKNDTQQARDILNKALKISPQQVVLLQKLVELNIQEQKWQDASNAAAQLARIPRQKTLAKFYLATIFQGQGECAKAIPIYKNLARRFPEQLRVLNSMSDCYISLNKESEMISFLLQSLQANKENIAATLVLSDLYVANKQTDEAITLLQRLLDEKPDDIQISQSLAKIYVSLGRADNAIAVYQQGLQISPGNIRLSLALTSLYEQQKLYDKAVQIYEQLHAENPDLEVASNNLAVLLVEHFPTDDNLQRALQLVDSFVNSEQLYFQDTYAWVLLNMGRLNEALEIFKKLIIQAPDIPVFRYHLGVAEFKSGNNSSAYTQVEQAIELAKQGANFADREVAEKLMVEIVDKMQGR